MAKKDTPSYKAILNKYGASSSEVQNYFSFLPKLVQEFPYEVALAYLFLSTEKAQNRALYSGVVKLHRADATIADQATNGVHLTRESLQILFENIFGHKIPTPVSAKIRNAEKFRDKVIHGKK